MWSCNKSKLIKYQKNVLYKHGLFEPKIVIDWYNWLENRTRSMYSNLTTRKINMTTISPTPFNKRFHLYNIMFDLKWQCKFFERLLSIFSKSGLDWWVESIQQLLNKFNEPTQSIEFLNFWIIQESLEVGKSGTTRWLIELVYSPVQLKL